MSLDFTAMHLIVDGSSPSREALLKVFSDENEESFTSDKEHYIINKKMILENHFWLSIRYGKELPYTDTVINTNSFEEENNPRAKEQVEPHKQIFALYSITNKSFYIFNIRKTSFLENYLKNKLKNDVVIKAFFKSPEDFLSLIKTIEKVKLVTKKTLFSMDGGVMSISPEHKDIFGLGIPEEYCIEAKYKNAKPIEGFIENFKKMVNWRRAAEADSLICIGRDDKNFEAIFNVDSFSQKLSISIEKDSNGMFDPDATLRLLQLKLEGK